MTNDPFPFKVTFDFSSHAGSNKNQAKGFRTKADRAAWIKENRKNLSNIKSN